MNFGAVLIAKWQTLFHLHICIYPFIVYYMPTKSSRDAKFVIKLRPEYLLTTVWVPWLALYNSESGSKFAIFPNGA
jgi:hypothetical protein